MEEEKVSSLVIGSLDHSFAEKCVKWGEDIYVGDYDLIVIDLTTLGYEDFQYIITQNRKYFDNLRNQIQEVLIKTELTVICVADKLIDHGQITNYDWSPIIPIFEENPGSKINRSSLSMKIKYFDLVKSWERLYSEAKNNTTFQTFKEKETKFKIIPGSILKNQLGRDIAFSIKWKIIKQYDYASYSEELLSIQGTQIFLPPVPNQHEAIDILLQDFIQSEEEVAPLWTDKYYLPKEQETKEKIEQIEKNIITLNAQKEEATQDLQDITKFKKLLFSSGKTQLEPIVEEAFKILGIKLEHPEVDNLEDRIFKEGGADIPVEIRGKNSGLNEKDLNQLTSRFVDRQENEKYKTRGLFVLNHFRETPPSERGEAFNHNIVEKAKPWGVCLMTTEALYNLLEIKLSGEDLKDLSEQIFNTVGIFILPKEEIKDKIEK